VFSHKPGRTPYAAVPEGRSRRRRDRVSRCRAGAVHGQRRETVGKEKDMTKFADWLNSPVGQFVRDIVEGGVSGAAAAVLALAARRGDAAWRSCRSRDRIHRSRDRGRPSQARRSRTDKARDLAPARARVRKDVKALNEAEAEADAIVARLRSRSKPCVVGRHERADLIDALIRRKVPDLAIQRELGGTPSDTAISAHRTRGCTCHRT
jgi:hypothetical protein